MEETREDRLAIDVITVLEAASTDMKREQANPESRFDKRALAIALTHIETAQLWIANGRPDQ